MNNRMIWILAAGTAAAMQGCNENSDDRDNGYRSDGSRQATPARNDGRSDQYRRTDNAQPPMDSSQSPSGPNTWQTGDRGGTTLGSTYTQPTSPAGARAVSTDSAQSGQSGNSPANAENPSSPETRILSLLNVKDQHEIRMGQLAQERGSTEDVRNYGARLVKDHREHAIKVASVASSSGVTLMDDEQVKQMMHREKGEPAAPKDRMSADRKDKDPIAELQGLSGVEFDRAFALKMQEGHRKVIQKVQAAQNDVRNPGVRDLLDKTLVSLREHEQIASKLVAQSRADADR